MGEGRSPDPLPSPGGGLGKVNFKEAKTKISKLSAVPENWEDGSGLGGSRTSAEDGSGLGASRTSLGASRTPCITCPAQGFFLLKERFSLPLVLPGGSGSGFLPL